MFNQEALLEYLSSPEGINKIIVGIILVGAINAIFITYSVRSTYGAAKIEKEKINEISIISFYPKVIKEIKSIEPKLTANLLINFEGPKLIQEDEMVNVMHEVNADGIGAQNHKSFDQNFYNTISKERKKVHVWTVNSKKEAKKYHELGIDSITTNCPGKIKEYLSKSF